MKKHHVNCMLNNNETEKYECVCRVDISKFTPTQLKNWKAYEKVRKSGVTNMYAVNVVCDYSGLDREEVFFCMKNYDELKKQATLK